MAGVRVCVCVCARARVCVSVCGAWREEWLRGNTNPRQAHLYEEVAHALGVEEVVLARDALDLLQVAHLGGGLDVSPRAIRILARPFSKA